MDTTPPSRAVIAPVPGSLAASVPGESEIADEITSDPDEDPRQERAEALCREMVELTAHIGAAEARFLELLAEFDREEMWLWYGCHGAVQWLNWQCGLGAVAARERVRVARALEKLPKISAAFRRGEVSYSKVREMTRIAIPESEETLLMIARHGTAAHMQRLVRKYRRVERLEAAAEALEQYRRRYVHYRHEEDGMLVIEARLPAEVGEIVVKALDAAVEVLYQDGLREKRSEESGQETAAAATSVVETESEVPAEARSEDGCGGDADGDADGDGQVDVDSARGPSPDARRPAAAKNTLGSEPNVPAGTAAGAERVEPRSGKRRKSAREEQWLPVVRPWTEDVETEEDRARFQAFLDGEMPESDDEDGPVDVNNQADASSQADPSSRAEANSSDTTPRSTEQPSGPSHAGESGFVSPPWALDESSDDHAVIEEFEGEGWQDSLGARRADALRVLAETFLSSDQPRVDTSAYRYQVVVHIDHALLASGADRRERPNDHDPYRHTASLFAHCELEEGQALAIETARRLACDCALVGLVDGENGEPLNVGRKTRAISPALKRALRARDGGCRFPGCCRTRFIHAHHIIHWANGGETKLSNLISVCSFHHALLHEGGFSVKRLDDGAFVFFAPNGERLPETGQLDRETIDALTQAATRGRVTLRQLNLEHGLGIDEETAQCRWLGERMDYHMAVGGLIWSRDRAREGVGEADVH